MMKISNGITDANYNPPPLTRGQNRTEAVEKTRIDIPAAYSPKLPNEVPFVQTQEQKKEAEHEVIQAIERANRHFKSYDRRLEFSIHDATKQIMVKVIDTENNQIIREIPSEKILDMLAHLYEVAGMLVDEKR